MKILKIIGGIIFLLALGWMATENQRMIVKKAIREVQQEGGLTRMDHVDQVPTDPSGACIPGVNMQYNYNNATMWVCSHRNIDTTWHQISPNGEPK